MKQYLMMCDEMGMRILQDLYKSEAVQYLEVQGMGMAANNVNILVTPIIPPVNPMTVPPTMPGNPEQEEVKEVYT